MDLKFISFKIATKSNLIQILETKFKKSSCLYNFSRIKILIDSLKPEIQFLVEYPYTDSHYRSSFYMYYSAKYEEYERNAVRVHLFCKDLEKEKIENNDKSYLGFFIVRPLQNHPLGRTFINPKAFINDGFISCQCKMDVHLMNFSFLVSGFPHIAQDAETHSCAESSVWSLLSYFGLKYPEYRTFLPEEIIKNLTASTDDRLLPSTGLTADEIAVCLNASGQNCIIDYISDCSDSAEAQMKQSEDFAIMRIYVESGMPFVEEHTAL